MSVNGCGIQLLTVKGMWNLNIAGKVAVSSKEYMFELVLSQITIQTFLIYQKQVTVQIADFRIL